MAAITRLRYLLGIALFLRLFDREERSILYPAGDFVPCVAENDLRKFPECLQFVWFDVGKVLFLEAVDVNGTVVFSEQKDRPRPARFSFSGAGNALLDHSSAEVRIHQALIDLLSGPPKVAIGDAGFFREARKGLRLVNRHRLGKRWPQRSKYSTWCQNVHSELATTPWLPVHRSG